ncbi:MAG TPA: phosphoribosylaminoimidazolesuccinocarboxamide synthase [Stellaceae bacterium]|nr:phosphoribosylaminoimidazolesuccinocarboxamide synthase [Stellaceae bacterium]
MIDPDVILGHIDRALADATIAELPNHYRGKVRDNYDLPDGTRLLVATDRLSAFDRAIAAIPFKGQVLTETARFWFEATADLCPNHVIDYPDPNVLHCRRLAILPIEIVVRDYLAGTTATSIWSMYRTGRRDLYGLRFPDGLRENERLPQTVITPTTKAPEGAHDEPVTPDEILARGLLAAAEWQEVSQKALALFARGRDLAARRGLILVDTKYEFGRAGDGRILLADEIHTPDSSRYWFAETYPERFAAGRPPDSFDKDFLRRWVSARCDPYRDPLPPIPREVIAATARVYIDACERITGTAFALPQPDIPVLQRIRYNLRRFFAAA